MQHIVEWISFRMVGGHVEIYERFDSNWSWKRKFGWNRLFGMGDYFHRQYLTFHSRVFLETYRTNICYIRIFGDCTGQHTICSWNQCRISLRTINYRQIPRDPISVNLGPDFRSLGAQKTIFRLCGHIWHYFNPISQSRYQQRDLIK